MQLEMQLYSKKAIDNIINKIKGWDPNPDPNSNSSSLEKDLVRIILPPINGNELICEELIGFRNNNYINISENNLIILDSLIETYEKDVSSSKPTEVYQNAKTVLAKYVSKHLSLTGQRSLNPEIDNLNVIKTEIKVACTEKLYSFCKNNLTSKLQSEFNLVKNRAIARNTFETIDLITHYLILNSKIFPKNIFSKISLQIFYKKNGDNAPIMTFPEAIQRYFKTGISEPDGYDTIYFKLKLGDGRKEIIFLHGTGCSMPNTTDEALAIRNNLKEGLYEGEPIEVITGDEFNTKNLQNHRSASIYDESFGKINNRLFFIGINGGHINFKQIPKGHRIRKAYRRFAKKYYSFFLRQEKGLLRGWPVNYDHFYVGNFRG